MPKSAASPKEPCEAGTSSSSRKQKSKPEIKLGTHKPKVKGPNAVACDPGKNRLAFGCVDVYGKAKPLVYTIDAWTHPLLRSLLFDLFVPGSHLAIEGQYMGRNAATAIELGRVRGYVEGVAVSLGYKVRDVHPSTWHAMFGIRGKRVECKEQAAKVAAEYVAEANQDEADALCMALWLAKEMQHG